MSDEVTLPETIIRGTPQPAGGDDGTAPDNSILTSLLQSAKKLPGQTVGGLVDGINLISGGYANIVQAIRGQNISRQIGEGLVPKPVGGTQQLNDLFGISNNSTGLLEDSTSAVLGALNPGIIAGKVAGFSKALIVAATAAGRTDAEIQGAAKLLDAGVDASEVFQRTGMYRGPIDGRMKTVINDNTSQINPEFVQSLGSDGVQLSNTKQPMPLDEILGHPELFSLYPELKDVTIVSSPTLPKGAAQAYPPVNGQPGKMQIGPMSSIEELQSAVLHETQHMVQGIEGFSGGGTDTNFLPGGAAFNTSFRKIQDIAGQLKGEVATKFGMDPQTVTNFALMPQNAPPGLVADPSFQLYIKTRNAQAVAINAKSAAFNQYQRLAGEAEARSVQTAFDLGQTDDKLFLPTDLYMTAKGQYLSTNDLIASPFDRPNPKGKL